MSAARVTESMLLVCILACFLISVSNENAASQVQVLSRDYAREGIYFGFSLQNNGIGGDFDGEHMTMVYDAWGELIELSFVPELERGFGFGITAGYRISSIAAEASYIRTSHEWEVAFYDEWGYYNSYDGDAQINMISFDARFYPLTEDQFQPYITVGWAIPWITFEDASASEFGAGDVTYLSLSTFNGGVGVAFLATPQIAISGGILYRYSIFSTMKGAGGDWVEIDGSLNGGGLNFNIGISATL